MRVFTLGIDQAVNEAFLRRLAELGGGFCELVESEDRLDEVMDKVHRRIGTPVLTGLHAGGGRAATCVAESLVPARLPDLFAGVPLVVLGRYRGPPEGAVLLQGRDEAGRPWRQTVPAGRRTARRRPVWARGRLRKLEDRYVVGAADPDVLEKEIVALSLRSACCAASRRSWRWTGPRPSTRAAGSTRSSSRSRPRRAGTCSRRTRPGRGALDLPLAGGRRRWPARRPPRAPAARRLDGCL